MRKLLTKQQINVNSSPTKDTKKKSPIKDWAHKNLLKFFYSIAELQTYYFLFFVGNYFLNKYTFLKPLTILLKKMQRVKSSNFEKFKRKKRKS
ncbi:hypothetical protein [Kordia sp.]|uniref:hypothetical protein n=1 Tax=Kordia sp. TaxID=1965332 RepID=UPI0025C48B5E|nr:hypothetical protein [Kordia sp.]MCH2193025.1 hypothetical protein [Kordia sp.]